MVVVSFSQIVGTVTACITSEYTYILRFYVCCMCVCVCIVRMENSEERLEIQREKVIPG